MSQIPAALARRRRRGGEFNPTVLFASGEQGAWYDASDLSTMFQDAAGTVPVTDVEQPVRLMLDKSRGGGPIGPDTVINGTFAVDADWTKGTDWTIGSGVATKVAGSNTSLAQDQTLIPGRDYILTYTMTATAGTLTPRFSGGTVVAAQFQSASGTYTAIMRAVTGNTTLQFLGTSTFAGTVDNVTLRLLPAGSHATASADARRPVLSARVNLLTASEFPNGVTDAPTRGGDITATTMSGFAGALQVGWNGVASAFAYKAGGVNGIVTTLSVVVEMDDGLPPTFGSSIPTSSSNSFALVVGGATQGPSQFSVVSLGGARYRVSSTIAASTSGLSGVIKYSGNDNRTFKVTAYDLRVTNDGVGLPVYQRVTTATDYDTAGFPLYLAFDGTDDCLFTGNVDFTATDQVTVCAGVRKLSDAATGILVELSADFGTNNGSFAIRAPRIAAPHYNFAYTASAASGYDATTFAAPITNVLSVRYDGSGTGLSNQVLPQVNGIIPTIASVGGSPGNSNFGTYPLFIGARNNVGNRFNGRLYQLVVRGALTGTPVLEQLEGFVNAKTQAY
jgi:hypothetical protein